MKFLDTSVFSIRGITEIMDFEYIAYGNAKMSPSGVVSCQHGADECTANMAEECAKNQTGGSPMKYIPFDACLEDGSDVTTKGISKCAKKNKLDGDDIVKCLSDGRGTKLIAAAAKNTVEHQYVPYFIFNGKVLDDYSTLVKATCNFWKGAYPGFCECKKAEVCFKGERN